MSRNILTYAQFQLVRSRAAWMRRQADALEGRVFPDPRNQEQRDLGAELEWRQSVARHAIAAGRVA